jgi:transposase-like protein
MKKEKRPMRDRATEAKKTAAVFAIVSTSTIEQAAKMSKIARSTLFRWMTDQTFLDQLKAARAEIFASAIGTLKSATSKAAAVLLELLDSKREMTRFRASSAVLDFALRIHEGEEIDERLRRLEGIAAGGMAGGHLSISAMRQSLTDYQGGAGKG